MQKTKTNFIAFAFITSMAIFSCAENSKQKKTEASLTEPAAAGMVSESTDCSIDSFYLAKQDAKKMSETFSNIFQSKETGLQSSYWLDTCIISGFAGLLQSGNYDGVRLYNAAASKEGNGTDNPSFIIMAPTSEGKNTWGKILNLSDKCTSSPASFNIEKNDAYNFIYNFGAAYRMETKYGDHSSAKNDSLSIAIWLKKCVFELMAKAAGNAENKIDGFRIYAGAYDKLQNSHGQKYAHQSTIYIVPTSADGSGGHTDNWNIFLLSKQSSQQKNSGNGDNIGGGLNHADICPLICPDENP